MSILKSILFWVLIAVLSAIATTNETAIVLTPILGDCDNGYASHLKNIRSDLAITYCNKDIMLKHIAALEWLDANKVVIGTSSSSISDFLSLALVKKTDKKKEGFAIYKFPLAPPAGNHVLSDEPRAQYNHYFVSIDESTGLISEKRFNRYGW